MTKFILHGGVARSTTENNRNNFYKDFVSDLNENAIILLVYFAGDLERWPELFSKGKEIFSAAGGGKKFNFIMAEEENFVEQINKADAVYLHGGEGRKLDPVIKRVKNFKELVDGKVVAGSSAGANVLGKYYYSNNHDQIVEGAGVLSLFRG